MLCSVSNFTTRTATFAYEVFIVHINYNLKFEIKEDCDREISNLIKNEFNLNR
jgi:hypothetical protein